MCSEGRYDIYMILIVDKRSGARLPLHAAAGLLELDTSDVLRKKIRKRRKKTPNIFFFVGRLAGWLILLGDLFIDRFERSRSRASFCVAVVV